LHGFDCVCAELPRIALPVSILFIQHAFEHHRPTNTGRLAHAMLPGSRLVRFGVRGCPLDLSGLLPTAGRRYVLLRAEGAQTATREALTPPGGEPVTVVVLDGSWQHAVRMRRRIAEVRSAPCLALPPGEPSAWQVRRGRAPDELCTLEACARLVAILGQPDDARRMMDILTRVNRLTLCSRSANLSHT
jgi:DTW domain-containing protein YfiP